MDVNGSMSEWHNIHGITVHLTASFGSPLRPYHPFRFVERFLMMRFGHHRTPFSQRLNRVLDLHTKSFGVDLRSEIFLKSPSTSSYTLQAAPEYFQRTVDQK